MTHSLKWGKRLTAAAGVTALVAAGFAGATTASAADETAAKADPKVYYDLTPSAMTSVTLHKLSGNPASGTPASGYLEDAKGDPIQGVTFKFTPVGCVALNDEGQPASTDPATTAVNLDAEPDWSHVNGLKLPSKYDEKAAETAPVSLEKITATATNGVDASPCNTLTTGVVTSAPTDSDGVVKVTGLAHTAYVVTEVKTDAVKTPIDAFLMTIPHAYKGNAASKYDEGKKTGWLYEINIYPKNVLNQRDVTKAPVVPKGSLINPTGQQQDWNIVIPINQNAGKTDTAFKKDRVAAFDKLVDALGYKGITTPTLENSAGTAKDFGTGDYVIKACPDDTTAATATLQVCTDDPTAYTDENSVGSRIVLFELTEAGRGKIAVGDTLKFTLQTEIRGKFVKNSGSIANPDFAVTYDNTTVTDIKDPKGGSPQLTTAFVNVKKYMEGAEATTLAGATFDVYLVHPAVTTTEKGENGDVTKTTENPKNTAVIKGKTRAPYAGETGDQPLKGEKLGTYTTINRAADADKGIVAREGAFADNIKIALGDASVTTGTVYLVETAAPAGYMLPAADAFRVTELAVSNGSNNDNPDTAKVANVRKNIDTTAGLPITGAQGLMLLTLGGAAIVMVGVGSVMVIRRRQEQD